MNVDELSDRLRRATTSHSLRHVAKWCGVSHELIRKLSMGRANITSDKFALIDAGLRGNGF